MRISRLFSLAFLVVGLSLWTLAPYGGCACNNPLGPNDGPPPTPTPDHGPKVDDFEHPGSLATNFKGSISTAADNVAFPPDVAAPPSTLSHNSTINLPTSAIVAGGSTLPGGTPGYAAHISGFIGHDGSPYPYAQILLGLNTPANVPFYAPNKRLKFSLKANIIGPIFVNFTDSVITDYAWYRYQFTPANTNWNSYTVYFPDGVGTPKFVQAGFGVCKKWTASSVCAGPPQTTYVVDNINAVVFQPVPSASSRLSYDFYIDDVTFE